MVKRPSSDVKVSALTGAEEGDGLLSILKSCAEACAEQVMKRAKSKKYRAKFFKRHLPFPVLNARQSGAVILQSFIAYGRECGKRSARASIRVDISAVNARLKSRANFN